MAVLGSPQKWQRVLWGLSHLAGRTSVSHSAMWSLSSLLSLLFSRSCCFSVNVLCHTFLWNHCLCTCSVISGQQLEETSTCICRAPFLYKPGLISGRLRMFNYQNHPKLQSLPYLQQDGYSLLGLHLLASQCRKGIQEESQGIYGVELIIAPLSIL